MAENSSKVNPQIPDPDPNRDISNRSIDQLKDDIEDTRDAMGATIDAIQDKIDPRRVVGKARAEVGDKLREKIEPLGYAAQTKINQLASGVRGLSDSLAEKVRDNPDDLPKWGAMALAGLGAVTLTIGGLKKLRGRR